MSRAPGEARVAPADPFGQPINFELTLDGGQTFRWWRREPGVFEGLAGPFPVRLIVDPALPPGALRVSGERPGESPSPLHAALVKLLDLPRDYATLQGRLVARDPAIAPAVEATRGLRIARVPPWEALLSFILSSHTHIPRIKRMLARLCDELGGAGPGGLPAPEALAAAGERELRRLGLGYRAAYVARTAQMLAADPGYLDAGQALATPDLIAHLMRLPGVGEKVANCVALFGYGRWDAFPIDRWARRAVEQFYFGGERVGAARLRT
ncbi:MAG: DNA glycosylase, partial [Bacillota bacterium]